jgi:hypothetical protein
MQVFADRLVLPRSDAGQGVDPSLSAQLDSIMLWDPNADRAIQRIRATTWGTLSPRQ